jgi:hypothetical protein
MHPWWHIEESRQFRRITRTAVELSVRRSNDNQSRRGYELRLVGHGDHQSTIRQLYTACGSDNGPAVRFLVRIVREQARIKATTLTGATLGYFSQSDTERYVGVVSRIAERVEEIHCAAMVDMEWNGELFVALEMVSPAECTAIAAGPN